MGLSTFWAAFFSRKKYLATLLSLSSQAPQVGFSQPALHQGVKF
jgi:hypothetical protein